MKALSLHNPHAQLVRIGAKKWETRPRRMLYRGLLAIHATIAAPRAFVACYDDPVFVGAMLPSGTRLDQMTFGTAQGFARASVVYSFITCVVDVTDCIPTREWLSKFEGNPDMREEFAFGDYSVGRYAIKLENLRRLANPVHCRGFQGLWNVSKEAEAQINEQL